RSRSRLQRPDPWHPPASGAAAARADQQPPLDPVGLERDRRSAAQRRRYELADDAVADPLPPRLLDLRPADLLPDHAKSPFAREVGLELPSDPDNARGHRERAVLDGVGRELMQGHADLLGRLGVQLELGTFDAT